MSSCLHAIIFVDGIARIFFTFVVINQLLLKADPGASFEVVEGRSISLRLLLAPSTISFYPDDETALLVSHGLGGNVITAGSCDAGTLD